MYNFVAGLWEWKIFNGFNGCEDENDEIAVERELEGGGDVGGAVMLVKVVGTVCSWDYL